MAFTNELGKENLTMLTDFYELTMANGFLCTDNGERTVYFDMFFRTVPDKGGVAVLAGIQQVIEYIKNLKFTQLLAVFTIQYLASYITKISKIEKKN